MNDSNIPSPPTSATGPSRSARSASSGGGEAAPAASVGRAVPGLAEQVDAWEKNEVANFVKKSPERKPHFESLGGFPLKRTYTALDLADTPLQDIGLPGQYPFTRGPYPTMYRGRIWTMRQIAGFGTAEDTNRRFKYLVS